MAKIIRYSVDGFKPQMQTHHMKYVDYHMSKFDILDYPEHLKPFVLEKHNHLISFYRQHIDDFKCGLWVFLDGYKNNQSLNHLKHLVPCWEAEIDDSAQVYDCNWEQLVCINDPIVKAYGCYIPKRIIGDIVNIRRRTTGFLFCPIETRKVDVKCTFLLK